jgi:hypothetical protein
VFPGGFRSHLDADAPVGVNQRPEPLRRAGDAHVRSGVEVSDTRAGRSEAEGLAAAKLCDDLRYFAVRGKSYKYEQIIMKVHNVDEQEGGALRVTAERGGERKLRPAGHRTYMLKYLYKRSLKTKRSPVR